MFKKDLVDFIESGKLDVRLQMTTCEEDVKGERKRYIETLDKAVELFGDGDWHFVSAPGRTEIGGNHTDHQHGMVIAAAVNLDTLAAVKKNEDNVVRLRSAGFNIKDIDLSDLSIVEEQKNTTEALIRGIAARFVELGCKVAGFDGYSV
ncbi:MAG: galactokinase family protein, partial [Erysipelotrichaceae bacterium]|nr:galactokinase family protein [Erysipelotrichaceae bacterium]